MGHFICILLCVDDTTSLFLSTLQPSTLTWKLVDSCLPEHGKDFAHELGAGACGGGDGTDDLLNKVEQVYLWRRESQLAAMVQRGTAHTVALAL